MLRIGEPPPALIPVALTMGFADGCDEQGNCRASKRDRVTRVQLLVQSRRLKIARSLENADLLVKELVAYRPKVKLASDPAQADWREGLADDLILALDLAVWRADQIHGPDFEPSPGRPDNPRTDPGGRPMSALWTVLACIAVLALAVGTFIVFETGHARTAAQRQEFGNWLWSVVGVAVVALWAWNLTGRRRPRQ
jgi:hypothetical protein